MSRYLAVLVFVSCISGSVIGQSDQCAGTPCDCSQRHIVDCSGRGLTDIPKFKNNFFRGPIKLFDFSDNNFVTFDPNEFGINFASVSTIEVLDLSNNQLTSIANSFAVTNEVPGYEKLDLSNNKFTEFPGKALPLQFSPVDLEIDISNNYLTTIPMQFVANNVMELIPSLTLNASNNLIDSIHPMAFTGDLITELRLDLTSNHLTNISEDLFFPVSQNGEFKMSDNPWNCDCKFRWILTSDFRKMSLSSPPVCNDPAPLRTRNVFDLKAEEFVCRPKALDIRGEVKLNKSDYILLSCPVTADPEISLDVTWSFAVTCQPRGKPLKLIAQTKRVAIKDGTCFPHSTCTAENYAGSIEINLNRIITDGIESCPMDFGSSGGNMAFIILIILIIFVVASVLMCCALGGYYGYLRGSGGSRIWQEGGPR
ncbi:Protein slit [Holothuria leucospilota]|uniref:Protein slit n=1 Tax=Holothuria leucospilota TaxID=206669 RepID=A0A9Q0YLT0_HOLLE|nr:Protein slit [Holothuria leucospilota]